MKVLTRMKVLHWPIGLGLDRETFTATFAIPTLCHRARARWNFAGSAEGVTCKSCLRIARVWRNKAGWIW